jgi:3-hydroxyisobutyrate dehydrogenase
MRYGFIGLGNLGGHLAASLIRKGFDLVVYDLDPALADRHVGAGAERADSPRALAECVDHVFTCLPSLAASEAVLAALLGGAKPRTTPGPTWIECSTLGRDDILRLARVAEGSGMRVLEAPVTGGVHLAARGEITVLAGGETQLFEQHRPALEAIGRRVLHIGPLGSAALVKVITNMLAFIHLVADGEALMLAKRGGVDLAKAWEAIAASSGTSFVHETEGQLILNGSYDVGFTMNLALKDLDFATSAGRELGVPLELASLTEQIFVHGKEAYGGETQSTAIVRLLEDLLRTDLRAAGFPARLV